jgi:hypothetical protein
MWLREFREAFNAVTYSDLVAFAMGSGFGYFLARAWWG